MKKILFLFLSVSFLMACQNSGKQAGTSEQEVVAVSVDSILSNPAVFADQSVVVSGMVAHVCTHGGQKLFLVSSNPEKYLRINTGKSIPEFPIALEGSTIEVKGVVSKFVEEGETEPAMEESQTDTTSKEHAYHKDNVYVIVADSYTEKTN
ncbi:MAG: hypothetical protein H6538_04495 [Bacteroidales bacterium]|nr:hypothetical protein [Bacteroidales bacterium]MCB8999995.1 hypothetical protein [Bacteroidales bacterium]MCB9013276.1 hypothetical protein [Bacteroidales bacterium]